MSYVLQGLWEKGVRAGERLDVAGLLGKEDSEGQERIDVVVCGPGGLCGDVRMGVVERAKVWERVWEFKC